MVDRRTIAAHRDWHPEKLEGSRSVLFFSLDSSNGFLLGSLCGALAQLNADMDHTIDALKSHILSNVSHEKTLKRIVFDFGVPGCLAAHIEHQILRHRGAQVSPSSLETRLPTSFAYGELYQ